MGGKLRDKFNSVHWTRQEIRDYILRYASRELGPIYFLKDLPKENPAGRAIYLDTKLEIGDDTKEEKDILKIIEERGEARALEALEKIALKIFF